MAELDIAVASQGRKDDDVDRIFLARQAILDSDLEVVAYELLYRSGMTGSVVIDDADYATTKLITNTFLEFGIDNISEGKLVFINLPRNFIIGEIPIPLSPEKVVLEVLEDVSAEEIVINGMQKLIDEGFTFALDDFITQDENKELIPLSKIIKVDLLALSEDELRAEVEKLSEYNVELLAEKVETEDQFLLCKELGFKYFQGYFFSKPKLIEGKQLSVNQISLLDILAKLQNPDCQMEDIEAIVSNDLGLSYKLFRSINSSFYGLTKTVESIQHALILLGLDAVKKWVMLITLTANEEKPRELIALSLIRARMCEKLAEPLEVNTEVAFTLGLFSLLDAIMDQPLNTLLDSLSLSSEVKLALQKQEGPLGELLAIVIHYEKGEWEFLSVEKLKDIDVFNIYQEALEWHRELYTSSSNHS